MNSEFQVYSYYMKTYERCWWDKEQYQPSGVHVEGRDEKER